MQSSLEKICEKITEDVCGSSLEDTRQNKNDYGFDVNNFVKIMEVIAQTIQAIILNCPNKTALKASIKKPTFLQRIKFRNAIKEQCDIADCSKVKLLSGKISDKCISAVNTMTDEEIEQILLEIDSNDVII